MVKFVSWVMWLLCRAEEEDVGRRGIPQYLTRWKLWNHTRKLYLHCFHRGDTEPYFHDHPWPFWSLILWGGYWEETATPPDEVPIMGPTVRKWYGPGSLLRRPAEWRHRVVLPEGRRCWTLVWAGRKTRSWGFWCPGSGFMPWRQHKAREAEGKPGCGE